MKKILVLSANPVDTVGLRLDEEVREIQEALKLSNRRDDFQIVSLVALRVDDLRRGLLEHPPSIVHFSGHGESQGLILENDAGKKQLVGTEALAQFFALFPSIECVLLNACYSEVQAEAIHQSVNCVIGMSQEIGDRAAINFAVGFYDALGASWSYQQCFDMACNAIALAGIPESATPRIKIKQDSEKPSNPEYEDLSCPYKGLSHFETEDADFFYGRDVFIEELLAAAKTKNFIPILGDSGSGKSSLVFAGLVPRLQEKEPWVVIQFRPEKDPFHSLAWALMPFYTQSIDADQFAESRRLSDLLQNRKVPLADVFKRIQENHPQDRVLLIADQFEEIYTLCDDKQVRLDFLSLILTWLKSSDTWRNPPITVVTMRIDFYSNVLRNSTLADVFRNSDIKIRSMNHEELRDIIEKPANQKGVSFADGLVDRILDEVEIQNGNLPLLEFTLTELWKQRTKQQLTHEAYHLITYGEIDQQEGNGIKKALASYADNEYKKFSNGDQKKIQRIFVQLVQLGEGVKDTKRLATERELGEDNWLLVTKLADIRLVVTSRNADGQNTAEIVHEALIDYWDSLQNWIDNDRDFLSWQKRLRGEMTQWIKFDHDNGSLLQGRALGEAEIWLNNRLDELTNEQEFIELSIKKHNLQNEQQGKRRKFEMALYRNITLISFAGIVSITGLYTVSWQAIQRKELGEARGLGQYALHQFNAGQEIDALISLIKAGKTFKNQNATDPTALTALNEFVQRIRERNRFVGHKGSIKSLVFSPDNKLIASAGQDKIIRLWNKKGKLLHTLQGHKGAINKIVFSSDGEHILSASQDKTIKLWNIKGELIHTFQGHQEEVFDVFFNNDARTITSVDTDKIVKRWDIKGRLLQTLQNQNNPLFDIAVSPDGKTIASVDLIKGIKLWDINGNLIRTFTGHQYNISTMVFSPNGKILASTSRDKTVRLWNIDSGLSYTLKGHQAEIGHILFSRYGKDVAFSSDSKSVVSRGSDGVVKLWSANGKLISTIKGIHRGVSFSRNGTNIIRPVRKFTAPTGSMFERFLIRTL
jgi:energy-coupling factor transporter ATP-binding protein EcfA2